MLSPSPSHMGIRPILAAIRTVPIPPKPTTQPTTPVLPFITISRQPYSGAWTFAQQLVREMNAAGPSDHPWTCWDHELIEKVAADCHLSAQLIEAIENQRHSWISDFLASLTFADSSTTADEAKVYSRVVSAVRSLAANGHVVIVGLGGVFITRQMPGAIHICLVAPFENRLAFFIRQSNVKREDAPSLLHELERNRQAFCKRHWPNESLSPENFALTINTAEVDLATMILTVQSLVRERALATK